MAAVTTTGGASIAAPNSSPRLRQSMKVGGLAHVRFWPCVFLQWEFCFVVQLSSSISAGALELGRAAARAQ